MSDVSLSKAVRSNLLSLQSTANIMAKTQTRLATGLKVNSALDNPTNFFTAASLNGRAGDMSNLLDSMSSGIKTIEAADNGLKSITKTVESMQSTLRQARQDKSFKNTSLDVPTGPASAGQQLTFSGGRLSGSKSIDLTTLTGGMGPTESAVVSFDASSFVNIPTPVTSSSAMPARVKYGTGDIAPTTFSSGDSIDITVTVDGAASTFAITADDVGTAGNNDNVLGDTFELGEILNKKFKAGGIQAQAINYSGGGFYIDNTNPVTSGSTISISETTHQSAGGSVTALGLASGATVAPITGAAAAPYLTLNISIDGGPGKAIELGADSADAGSDIDSIAELAGLINAQYGSAVAFENSTTGALEFRSSTTGSGSKVTLSAVYNIGGDEGGLYETSAGGGTKSYKTVDQLVQDINNDQDLSGAVRASNNNGQLRLENLSTADMALSGSLGARTVGGNDVRENLVKQYNDLRDQLDKFADDASFNGINLLRGDKLKLTFNETGTSTIEVQAEDARRVPTSINSMSLGINAALGSDFDADSGLDAMLDTMKGALDALRSQSSSFGSNLSVVENRQDFTKSMINTLETGAADLTLADTNQEAANLLALQTRQQLSSSALSMASQADQAVLRLF